MFTFKTRPCAVFAAIGLLVAWTAIPSWAQDSRTRSAHPSHAPQTAGCLDIYVGGQSAVVKCVQLLNSYNPGGPGPAKYCLKRELDRAVDPTYGKCSLSEPVTASCAKLQRVYNYCLGLADSQFFAPRIPRNIYEIVCAPIQDFMLKKFGTINCAVMRTPNQGRIVRKKPAN